MSVQVIEASVDPIGTVPEPAEVENPTSTVKAIPSNKVFGISSASLFRSGVHTLQSFPRWIDRQQPYQSLVRHSH
jgi:hypothetical protein